MDCKEKLGVVLDVAVADDGMSSVSTVASPESGLSGDELEAAEVAELDPAAA